jgi:hypothetical protein
MGPRTDERNVAVLSDDCRWWRLVGGAAIVVVVGEALGEESAVFAAESGDIDCSQETHHVNVSSLYCPIPLSSCIIPPNAASRGLHMANRQIFRGKQA